MGNFIGAMGLVSIPLILSSIIAVVVIISLFMSLQKRKVLPSGLTEAAQKLAASGKVTPEHITKIRNGSLLGRVLATGLENIEQPRHILKENVEEVGRHVIHTMDKYMTTLGTIAAIAPLLGLFGTVIGMIDVFSVITAQGVGSPTELAGGISKALLTTAFGIGIAVPSLIFHRFFRGKINDYAIEMEKSAIKLLSVAGVPARKPVNTPRVNSTASRRPTATKAPIRKPKVPVRGGRVA